MPIPGFTAKETVPEAMHEWKKGDLHSGKGGPVVKDPKQAIAIGYSMADQNRKKDKNRVHRGIHKGFHT